MTSKPLRMWGLVIFSVFIIWHVIAILVIGPFSKSYLRDSLMTVYGGYMNITKLGRSWPFYAPEPFLGSILRYQTVSSQGQVELHKLTEAYKKLDHAYFRYTNFYAYLFRDPQYTQKQGYDKSVARHLCARHQGHDVKWINFVLVSQKRFNYQDYLDGKQPLDPEFLTEQTFGPYSC